MRRQTYSVNYYCRDQKAKDGKAPVELVVTINGERKVTCLPQKFSPDEFKRLRVSPRKNPVNTYLGEVTADIDWIHQNFPSYSPARILDAYNQGVRPGSKYIMRVRELSYKFMSGVIGKRPSLCRYRATYEKFNDRFGNWNVDDITGAEIKTYIEELRGKGYKDSTLFNEYKRLKALFQYAFDLRVTERNPFAGLQIRFEESKEQVFLTKEELEKFYNVPDLPPYLERARDLAVWIAGSGQEWTDCKHLEKGDVQRDGDLYYIRKNRIKTGVQYVAVLIGFAPEIWEKYNGELNSIVISNQKLNTYIRKVAEKAGIQKHLTSLTFRHTYATLLLSGAYGKMIPVDVLRRCLGHQKIDMSYHYAKLLDDSVLNAFR